MADDKIQVVIEGRDASAGRLLLETAKNSERLDGILARLEKTTRRAGDGLGHTTIQADNVRKRFKEMNEPLEKVRGLVGALGVASSTAVGQVNQVGGAMLAAFGAGGPAAIGLAAVTAGIGLVIEKHQENARAAEESAARISATRRAEFAQIDETIRKLDDEIKKRDILSRGGNVDIEQATERVEVLDQEIATRDEAIARGKALIAQEEALQEAILARRDGIHWASAADREAFYAAKRNAEAAKTAIAEESALREEAALKRSRTAEAATKTEDVERKKLEEKEREAAERRAEERERESKAAARQRQTEINTARKSLEEMAAAENFSTHAKTRAEEQYHERKLELISKAYTSEVEMLAAIEAEHARHNEALLVISEERASEEQEARLKLWEKSDRLDDKKAEKSEKVSDKVATDLQKGLQEREQLFSEMGEDVARQVGEGFADAIKTGRSKKLLEAARDAMVQMIASTINMALPGLGSVAGGFLSALFHDGGPVGRNGRVTGHDGLFPRGRPGSRPGTVGADLLEGESVFSIAATNNMGGSAGASRLNRALSQGGGGGLSIGKLVLQMSGSVAMNERDLERKMPRMLRKAIVQGLGPVERAMRDGRPVADLARGG